MNTTNLLTRWSTLSLDEIEAQLQNGDAPTAEQLFGPDEVEEMRAISQVRAATGPREAVIFLPGIMGSLLTSIRGATTLTWLNPAIFLKGQTHYLALNEDGSGDANPLIDTAPLALEKISYLKLALTLRRQTLLFEFPYDWRRPIEYNAELLQRCIERWAGGNDAMQFSLVAHSMGGLVSRSYLARHPAQAERQVKRLIMQGTPNFGAAGAVSDLALGNSLMAIAAKLNANNALHQVVLDMPSVYQLLPAPRELFPAGRPYPADWNVYYAAKWGIDGIRQDYLDGGRRFHEDLAASDPQVAQIEIAGCHVGTIVDVQRKLTAGAGETPLQTLINAEGEDSGDGTVPLWSARLPGAVVYYIQEVHRNLPRNKQVIKATLELIQSGDCDLPSELPAPKAGLFGRRAVGSLDDRATRLRLALEDGTASEEDLSELFFL